MVKTICFPGLHVKCKGGEKVKKMLILYMLLICMMAQKVCCLVFLMDMGVMKSQNIHKLFSNLV